MSCALRILYKLIVWIPRRTNIIPVGPTHESWFNMNTHGSIPSSMQRTLRAMSFLGLLFAPRRFSVLNPKLSSLYFILWAMAVSRGWTGHSELFKDNCSSGEKELSGWTLELENLWAGGYWNRQGKLRWGWGEAGGSWGLRPLCLAMDGMGSVIVQWGQWLGFVTRCIRVDVQVPCLCPSCPVIFHVSVYEAG